MDYLEKLLNRKSHYREIFNSRSGKVVLSDLRRFCRATEPTIVVASNGQTDVFATGMAAGRQEVFWRIANHLSLDDSQLLKLKETTEYE